MLLTRITRALFSRNIFTKSETFWSEMPIFGQIYADFAKTFAKNFIFLEKCLTRLTRKYSILDPSDLKHFSLRPADPTCGIFKFADPTRPVATRSIPTCMHCLLILPETLKHQRSTRRLKKLLNSGKDKHKHSTPSHGGRRSSSSSSKQFNNDCRLV